MHAGLHEGDWLAVLQGERLASLGQLVAGVAHEINNPVSLIVGNVDLVRDRLAVLRDLAGHHRDAEVETMVERIDRVVEVIARGAERTARIVQDLRCFSRVGDAAAGPVDLHEGIELSLRLLRPRWEGRIAVHRDYGAIPCVEGVPGQLHQVLMHLLANACDAIPGRGNVRIETASDGALVTVTIEDDGVGIPREDLARIFEPFFTTKAEGRGVGLGLAVSHGIVAAHGGRLEVQSVAGAVTTFRVRLPVPPHAALAAELAAADW